MLSPGLRHLFFAATCPGGTVGGGQNREDARAYGTLAGIAGFLLCSATGLALFFLARPLAGLFTTDQAVIDQAALVLRIVSVSEPFFAAFIVLSGALRGAHDVRFPMFLALFCMWGSGWSAPPFWSLYWMWAWRASDRHGGRSHLPRRAVRLSLEKWALGGQGRAGVSVLRNLTLPGQLYIRRVNRWTFRVAVTVAASPPHRWLLIQSQYKVGAIVSGNDGP
ncbi:MAG: MATE family efflux transporter [Intestinimonas sp.]